MRFSVPHNLVVAHNPAIFATPLRDVWDFVDASNRSVYAQPDAGTPPLNVCRREPAPEKLRCPDTEAHRKSRNNQDCRSAIAGLARRISSGQKLPARANNPSHTQSCRFPDRSPYKYGSRPGAYHEERVARARGA